LFRHLPDFYPAGSAYAHFPMMVPEKMRDFAKDHHPDEVWRKYDWNRPHVPVGPTVVVNSYSGVQKLFAQPTVYTSGSQQRLGILTGGVQLDLTSVRPPLHSGRRFTQFVFPRRSSAYLQTTTSWKMQPKHSPTSWTY
jgi:linoleate 10R-lipoxygenase